MTHASLTYEAEDEVGTERLGRALAELLPEGSVVALNGPLGAGKTRLVQAAATALGVDRRDVVSPTFVLAHEYQGRRPLVHLDAYRLRDVDEFWHLGAEDYLAAPYITFVEWAERVAPGLPDDRLEITISVLAGNARRFNVTGRGASYAHIVEQLRAALEKR